VSKSGISKSLTSICHYKATSQFLESARIQIYMRSELFMSIHNAYGFFRIYWSW